MPDFFEKLKQEINIGLPGWDAQKHMAPAGRSQNRYIPSDKSKTRESGVLIWLYPAAGNIYTRLIRMLTIN